MEAFESIFSNILRFYSSSTMRYRAEAVLPSRKTFLICSKVTTVDMKLLHPVGESRSTYYEANF